MSIILRDNGLIKIYVKGADSIIKSRLNKNIQSPYLNNIEVQLDEFSRKGLRCLL